jgi:hypothetical protein
MAALILPLISDKNGAVYDSTLGVISRLLQSDVAKAGDPQRASEILVRVVKREHLPSHRNGFISATKNGFRKHVTYN